jgi:hypothetical protein
MWPFRNSVLGGFKTLLFTLFALSTMLQLLENIHEVSKSCSFDIFGNIFIYNIRTSATIQ